MTPTAFQPFYYCYLRVFVYGYVCACPWRPEEPVTFPGVGVTGPLTLCVLGAQLRSSGRDGRDLYHPTPGILLSNNWVSVSRTTGLR